MHGGRRLQRLHFWVAMTLLVQWQEGHHACEQLSVGVVMAVSWLEHCMPVPPPSYSAAEKMQNGLTFCYRLTQVSRKLAVKTSVYCLSLLIPKFYIAKWSIELGGWICDWVRGLKLRSAHRGFDSRPLQWRSATLGKWFKHVPSASEFSTALEKFD